jgi:sulfur-oxidizing protein SoxX
MNKKIFGALIILVLSPLAVADSTQQAFEAMQQSFSKAGQAGMERLQQDETQRLCSAGAASNGLTDDALAKILAANEAAVKLPADGNYFGDWKRGQAIAQLGTGLQSSDDPAKPAGGNCYACHQMAESEIAYGTIGPSLLHYGKLRGNSQPIVDYTWRVLYNAKSYFACTHMPRFGSQGILDEQQLRDVMSYLLDPESSVNQ